MRRNVFLKSTNIRITADTIVESFFVFDNTCLLFIYLYYDCDAAVVFLHASYFLQILSYIQKQTLKRKWYDKKISWKVSRFAQK